MNNAQRARELLIEARRRIEERQNTFICSALMDAERDRDEDRQWDYFNASYALRLWIADMLLPYSTYDNWIWQNHRHLMAPLHRLEQLEKLREGRLAWIDWMLEQDLSRIVRKYNR